MHLLNPSSGTKMSLPVILSMFSFISSAFANPIHTQQAPWNETVKRSALKHVVIPTEDPLPFPVSTPFVTVAKYVNGTSTSTTTLDVSTGTDGWVYFKTIIKGPSAPEVTGTSKEDNEHIENQSDDEDADDGQHLQTRRDSLPTNIVGGDSDSESVIDHELAFDVAPMPGYDISPTSSDETDMGHTDRVIVVRDSIPPHIHGDSSTESGPHWTNGPGPHWTEGNVLPRGKHEDIIVVRDSIPPHIHGDSSTESGPHWTNGPGPHWTQGDVVPRGTLEDFTPSDEHSDFDSEDADAFGPQGTGSKSDPILVTDTSDFDTGEDVKYTS